MSDQLNGQQINAPLYQALENQNITAEKREQITEALKAIPIGSLAVATRLEEVKKLPPCPGETHESTGAVPLAILEALRKRCPRP